MNDSFFTEKQQKYWVNATKKWNVKSGAAGVGKTWMDMFLIPHRIMATNNEPGSKIVIIGNTLSTVRRNVIEPLREYYGNDVSEVSNNGKCRMFGRTVDVFGAEKITAKTKIQGMNIEYAYGDEVATWNEEFFNMFKARMRLPNSTFDGTCNPEHPTHWFKKFIDDSVENGSMYHQHYVLDDGRLSDNPIEDKRIKDEMRRDQTGVSYDRLVLGRWARAAGLVYTKFAGANERHFINSGDVPKLRKLYIGVDFGQSTKSRHAFVATGISHDNKVYILASELLEPDMSENIAGDRYVEFLRMVEYKFNMMVDCTYGDSARSTGIIALRSSLNKSNLVRTVWTSLKLPVNDRISGTNMMISQDRLFYTELAESARDSFNDAMWDPKVSNGEKRLDEQTDILDAFEYSYERELLSLLRSRYD